MKTMKKRKGFTLTELAIVIAVIAILIAVLVPTFTSLINKAHESTDSQLAKNMNTLLATAETDGDKPTRMDEVNEILVDGGYTIAKLTPSADNNIFVWNEETNRISYVSTEDWTVIYAGDSTLTADETFSRANNYWVTVESASEISSWSGLSYYFGKTITGDVTFALNSDSSIDTGTYKLSGTLTYTSASSSSAVEQQAAKTSVNSVKTGKAATSTTTGTATLRGTITDLEVDSSIKVVNYASITSKATITSAMSYTESGYVKELVVNTSTKNTVTIANNGVVGKISTDNNVTLTDVVTNNGYIVDAGSSNLSTSSSGYSYEISSYTELASFRDKVNNGATFKDIEVDLTADIDLSGRAWVPIGYDSRDNYKNTDFIYFAGIFNGNGHTISGLSNDGYVPTYKRTDTYGQGSGTPSENNYSFGLFGIIYNAEISSLKLTNVNIVTDDDYLLDSVGAVAGFGMGNVKITGCTVSGSIVGTDAIAGIIGRIYSYNDSDTVEISGCTNNAAIEIDSNTLTAGSDKGKAAGIVGFYNLKFTWPSSDGNDDTTSTTSTTPTISVKIEDCKNTGKIESFAYGAGIIVAQATSDENYMSCLTVKSCSNSGTISGAETGQDRKLGSIISWQSNNSSSIAWTVEDCINTGTIVVEAFSTTYKTCVWDITDSSYTCEKK